MIEEHHNLITAQQMARAIDREYIRRKDDSHQNTTYRCKTCGNEFKRRSSSRLSKDYCNRCLKGPRTVLAREEVDEIRHLAATQHLSCEELAEMYGKGKATIHHIINEYTWKPEHDPRRKESTP